MLCVQEVILRKCLPFINLVESTGTVLMRYRVESFAISGSLFCNLARLSAAGSPVIAVHIAHTNSHSMT